LSEQQPDPNSEENVQPSKPASITGDTHPQQAQGEGSKLKPTTSTSGRQRDISMLLGVLGSLIAGVATLAFGLVNLGDIVISTSIQEPVSVSEEEIDTIRQDIDSIHTQLESLQQIPEDTAIAMRLQSLEETMANLESTLTDIEEIIVQDPEEALEITMLRRDIEQAQAFNQSQVDALVRLIEQTNTWVTVSVLALAIAVLAPSLERLREWFRGSREQPADEE
jgi:hypothetical protein